MKGNRDFIRMFLLFRCVSNELFKNMDTTALRIQRKEFGWAKQKNNSQERREEKAGRSSNHDQQMISRQFDMNFFFLCIFPVLLRQS